MSFHPESLLKTLRALSKHWLGYTLAFLFATGAFFYGLQIGHGEVINAGQTAGLFDFLKSEPAEAAPTRPELAEFWNVWDLLEEKYATGSTTIQISNEERVRGAIQGLVDAYGDPYTVYFPPEEASVFDENISGNFSGVGMEVGLREKLVTVIAPLPDTPAEKAGILAGDVVVKINGTSTEGMRIDEAVNLIRGEKGSVVNLQIYREGEEEFLNFSVTRDTINIPTVKTEKIGDTFIIAIYSFNAIAEEQTQNALKEFIDSKAKNLVLDLRGNPGGYLQSAVSIASYFLPAGKIVVQEQFGESAGDEVFRSQGRLIKEFTPKNLVVLVDNGSASASEILAGALKDHGVATIIGTQTFGKGSVQELVKLDGNASVKITVARWLTPNGTSISQGGLAPDIVIERTPEDRVANKDPQKDATVDFLKGKKVESQVVEKDKTE